MSKCENVINQMAYYICKKCKCNDKRCLDTPFSEYIKSNPAYTNLSYISINYVFHYFELNQNPIVLQMAKDLLYNYVCYIKYENKIECVYNDVFIYQKNKNCLVVSIACYDNLLEDRSTSKLIQIIESQLTTLFGGIIFKAMNMYENQVPTSKYKPILFNIQNKVNEGKYYVHYDAKLFIDYEEMKKVVRNKNNLANLLDIDCTNDEPCDLSVDTITKNLELTKDYDEKKSEPVDNVNEQDAAPSEPNEPSDVLSKKIYGTYFKKNINEEQELKNQIAKILEITNSNVSSYTDTKDE